MRISARPSRKDGAALGRKPQKKPDIPGFEPMELRWDLGRLRWIADHICEQLTVCDPAEHAMTEEANQLMFRAIGHAFETLTKREIDIVLTYYEGRVSIPKLAKKYRITVQRVNHLFSRSIERLKNHPLIKEIENHINEGT